MDHRNGTLHFGGLQLESDRMRSQLSLLAKRLSKAAGLMGCGPPASVEAGREAAMALAREQVAKEHSRLLARKQVRRPGRAGAGAVQPAGAVWCWVPRRCAASSRGSGCTALLAAACSLCPSLSLLDC